MSLEFENLSESEARREARIRQLIEFARSEMNRVQASPSKGLYGLIVREARKRFFVSKRTAKDYASSAFSVVMDEYKRRVS